MCLVCGELSGGTGKKVQEEKDWVYIDSQMGKASVLHLGVVGWVSFGAWLGIAEMAQPSICDRILSVGPV